MRPIVCKVTGWWNGEFAPGVPEIQDEEVTSLPLLIGDPAYSLHLWYMKPFTGCLDAHKDLFNYQLSNRKNGCGVCFQVPQGLLEVPEDMHGSQQLQ
ncbi:hypothetical protein Y1Q_0010687 [Alligator mississippiensis]|uniref:DDE Tnp4 domain-containing protein n=1 Tax=Alligator mississippiensis TaxID=8496 RepID=A0A151M6H4_ALLMI|nr:hypothetical protein Y1Q_0010687 [Alligator mississippiensis]